MTAILKNRDNTLATAEQALKSYRNGIDPYYMHLYIPDGTVVTTPTLTAGVRTKINLGLSIKENRGFSIIDLGGGNLAIQFDGINETDTILFEVETSTSVSANANNIDCELMIYKDGVVVPGAKITRRISTGADVGAVAATATVQMATGDYIEFFGEVSSDAQLSFTDTSFAIKLIAIL